MKQSTFKTKNYFVAVSLSSILVREKYDFAFLSNDEYFIFHIYETEENVNKAAIAAAEISMVMFKEINNLGKDLATKEAKESTIQ